MTEAWPDDIDVSRREKRKGGVWNFEKGRERAIKMAALNAAKTRIAPPITLPRVKFLEVPFVD